MPDERVGDDGFYTVHETDRPPHRRCNLHADCDEFERDLGGHEAYHCYDPTCQDCCRLGILGG